jgi:RNA polymerase primary sigma factor
MSPEFPLNSQIGLNPKEERILRIRFGIGSDQPCSLEEIAQEYDVTRERIRLDRDKGHKEAA